MHRFLRYFTTPNSCQTPYTMTKITISRKANKASSKRKDQQRDTDDVGWIVEDQLILDLATGRVGDASFPLSEIQQNLKIDRSIVYLSTLCFAEQDDMVPTYAMEGNVSNKSSISSRVTERFATLQAMYHSVLARQETNGVCQSVQPSVLFELSPRLCPSKEQLEVVVRDLKAAKDNLTRKVQQAADLLEECNEQNKFRAGKRGHQQIKNRPPNSMPATYCEGECAFFPVVEQRQPKQDTKTLEELLRPRYVSENPEISSKDDVVGASWIEISKIKRKGSSSMSPTILSTVLRSKSSAPPSVNKSITPILPTKPRTSSRGTRDGEITGSKVARESKPTDDQAFDHNSSTTDKGTVVKGEHNSQCGLSPDMFNTSYDKQKERIQVLEASMEEMKREHAKTLQQERQRHDDLVQSLQLRLYISETRLKTYEEALQTHIQAVALNVNGGGQSSSPDRMIVATEKSEEVAFHRSLITKALQKINEQNEKSLGTISGNGRSCSCTLIP
jgi:hypothetical protein